MANTEKDLFEHAAEFAKNNFDDTGELTPMWLLSDGGKNIYCVISPFVGETDEEAEAVKNGVSMVIKKMIKEHSITMLAFIAEAWVVEARSDVEDVRKIRPSKHEDRREVIHIFVESKDKSLMGGYYILRPEHGKPKLSPLRMNRADGTGGRFAGLLK